MAYTKKTFQQYRYELVRYFSLYMSDVCYWADEKKFTIYMLICILIWNLCFKKVLYNFLVS